MAGKAEVIWSARAISKIDSTYNNLLIQWGPKEADHFLDLLQEFANVVSSFPKGFPVSKKLKAKRIGMIHQNVSAIYTINSGRIYVVTLIDNRSKNRYK